MRLFSNLRMLPNWRSYPKPPGYVDKRNVWKSRLSKAYLFFSMNALILTGVAHYTGKLDWVNYYGLTEDDQQEYKSYAHFWIVKKKIENPTVYRVSGMSITNITDKIIPKENEETSKNTEKEIV